MMYILPGILLSCLGAWIYRKGVPEQVSPPVRRRLIHALLALSLLGPVVCQPLLFDPPHGAQGWIWHQIFAPSTQQLQSFCQCQAPEQSHKVLYTSVYLARLSLFSSRALYLLVGTGAILALLLLGFRLIYLGRLIHKGRMCVASFQGQAVRLLVISAKGSPYGAFVLGKAYVVVDEAFFQRPEWERQAILAHEMAHIRQKNTLEQGLLQVLQVLWLLNPAFYFFRRELIWLSECQADDAAVGYAPSRAAYARMLLNMAGPAPHLPTALKGGQLAARIRRLLQADKVPAHSRMAFLGPLVFQVLCLLPLMWAQNQWLAYDRFNTKVLEVNEPVRQIVYCRTCTHACLVCE